MKTTISNTVFTAGAVLMAISIYGRPKKEGESEQERKKKAITGIIIGGLMMGIGTGIRVAK